MNKRTVLSAVFLLAGVLVCAAAVPGCSAKQLAEAQTIDTTAQTAIDATAPAVATLQSQVAALDAKLAAATTQASGTAAALAALKSQPTPPDPVALSTAQDAATSAGEALAAAQKADAAGQQAVQLVSSLVEPLKNLSSTAGQLITQLQAAKTGTQQAQAVVGTVGTVGAAVPGIGTWITAAAAIAGIGLSIYQSLGKSSANSTLADTQSQMNDLGHAIATTIPAALPSLVAALPADTASTLTSILQDLGHFIPAVATPSATAIASTSAAPSARAA